MANRPIRLASKIVDHDGLAASFRAVSAMVAHTEMGEPAVTGDVGSDLELEIAALAQRFCPDPLQQQELFLISNQLRRTRPRRGYYPPAGCGRSPDLGED